MTSSFYCSYFNSLYWSQAFLSSHIKTFLWCISSLRQNENQTYKLYVVYLVWTCYTRDEFCNCDNIININTERELSECRSRTHAQPLWYSWNYSRNSHLEKLKMKVKTYPLIKFIFIAHQASLKYLGKICLIHLWFLSACHDIYNLISSHRSLLKRRIMKYVDVYSLLVIIKINTVAKSQWVIHQDCDQCNKVQFIIFPWSLHLQMKWTLLNVP